MTFVVTVVIKTVTKVVSLREMVLMLDNVDSTIENCVVDDCNDDDTLLSALSEGIISEPEELLDRLCEVEALTGSVLLLADLGGDVEVDTVLMLSFEEVSVVVVFADNVSETTDDKLIPSLVRVSEGKDEGVERELLSLVALIVGCSVVEVLEDDLA